MIVPAPDDVIGNRYQVLQVLRQYPGRVTVLARDRITQQPVVVKLLSFSDTSSWQEVTFFEREVKTLQHLNHPGIPRYLDTLDLPERHQKGLVQTYIPAPSLQERLKLGQRFAEGDLVAIARQVLEILHYLHEQQPPVIHRDLKPSNILRDQEGKVYLVDFGSVQAKLLGGEGTMTLAIPGTSGYIAPEQYRNRAVPASDLYSLGATLVALASGRDPDSLPEKELHLDFTPYVTLSPPLIRWLQRLLDPRLEYRFGSARAAQAALEDGEPETGSSLAVLPATPPARIQVHQRDNGQELVLPSQGWSAGSPFLVFFTVAWVTFTAFWTGMALVMVPGLLKVIFVLFSLPFWAAGWLMLTQGILPALGRYRLQWTADQINLVQEWWGFRWHRPASRHQLTGIELRPSVQQAGMALLSGGDLIYQVKVIGREESYLLGSLKESEAHWCGQYLAHELGIPLQVLTTSEVFPKARMRF